MKKILFVTTVYRTGEKIYSILPYLCQKYVVDVLNVYQMSRETAWVGNKDLRESFYDICESLNVTSFHGPKWHRESHINSYDYGRYFSKLNDLLRPDYDLVLVDNNVTIKGGQMSMLYECFRNRKTTVIACPHGNRNVKGYRIHKRIGRHYDYSFVFGSKERSRLSAIDKKSKNKLLRGGIPANDKLKNYQRTNQYILVIPNIADPKQIKGQVKGMTAFTKKDFDKVSKSALRLGRLPA